MGELNGYQILGWLLLSLPLIGIAAFCWYMGGWVVVAAVFGGTAAALGIIFAGLTLIDHERLPPL